MQWSTPKQIRLCYLDLFSIHHRLEGHVLHSLANGTHGGTHENAIPKPKEVVSLSYARLSQ